jgi:hypothetical protein
VRYLLELQRILNLQIDSIIGRFMKVKCDFDSHRDVSSLHELDGYFDRSILHITIGKEYTVLAVYAVTIRQSGHTVFEYLIRDDLDDVSNYSVKLFTVVDSNIGDCQWHCDFANPHVNFLLCSEIMVHNLEHYEGFFDRNPDDRSKFMKWAETVEHEQALRDSKRQ